MTATQAALAYTEAIVETVREPLLVLDNELHVVSANNAFYKYFRIDAKKVNGHFFYGLGRGEWDIKELREMLERILTQNEIFDNFEVRLKFTNIGEKRLLLNARRISHKGVPQPLILLAMEEAK